MRESKQEIKSSGLCRDMVFLEETYANILWRNGPSIQDFKDVHRKSWILHEFSIPQYIIDQRIIHLYPETTEKNKLCN